LTFLFISGFDFSGLETSGHTLYSEENQETSKVPFSLPPVDLTNGNPTPCPQFIYLKFKLGLNELRVKYGANIPIVLLVGHITLRTCIFLPLKV
jgi:hypothetical protein